MVPSNVSFYNKISYRQKKCKYNNKTNLFLCACKDSCPLSSSLELPSSELLELLELLEQLELSDARPVLFFKSTESATIAKSGSLFFNTLYHLRDNFGRPLTVLCHTTGKLVRLQKF